MSNNISSILASISLRLCLLLIISLIYILGGGLLIENNYFIKIFPPSNQRSIIILLLSFASISYANYFSAHYAKNIMDWKTEIAILLFYFLLITSFLGPRLFKYISGETGRVFKTPEYSNRDSLFLLILLTIPAILFIFRGIKKYLASFDRSEHDAT